MKLNFVEYWLMNNPIRALIQRRLEGPRLAGISSRQAESILEIGCGQGAGAKIIYETFRPQKYVGIDLDSRMIRRAEKTAAKLPNATFMEGDASKLTFDDGIFDLVVDFGIVHHIPNWRDALAEIHRTLKAGGEFLFEELSAETWESGSGRLFKKVLDHPYDEMFSQREFEDELNQLGFQTEIHEDSRLGLFHLWGKATKLNR
jgi:ubiquinone/menaquinone biosynthesis C-methylase UbiE